MQTGNALSYRRLQASVCDNSGPAKIVASRVYPAGATVTLGGPGSAGLVVPRWTLGELTLISEGALLHLTPGMHVNMCDDDGGGRVRGTFEELTEAGLSFPMEVRVCKLNVRARADVSVFVRYLADGELPRPEI